MCLSPEQGKGLQRGKAGDASQLIEFFEILISLINNCIGVSGKVVCFKKIKSLLLKSFFN